MNGNIYGLYVNKSDGKRVPSRDLLLMVNKCSVFECMKLSIEFMVIYSQVERHKACGESSERFLSRSFTLARDIIRINLV